METASTENQADIDEILSRLRVEFIDVTRDMLDDIDTKLDQFAKQEIDPEDIKLSIQREMHNIKGQGSSYGFPLVGRMAHMLEDYILNAHDFSVDNIAPVRVYIEEMISSFSYGEPTDEDDIRALLNSLPTGKDQSFSSQKAKNINVLLVMPSGMQRKMIATELLSCGFRVMRAYNATEALSVAIDIVPDMVFVNYDMTPFDGRDLSKVFGAVEKLRDIHIVLLTSYEANDAHLKDLPSNVAVVQKKQNFLETIGEIMIEWNVFGSSTKQ